MKEAQKQLKAALLGYGLGGAVFHAPLMHACRDIALAAIVTGNAERRAEAQARYPGIKLYANSNEFFADADKYDLAVISTTNDSHAPLARQALQNKLAVVIDKPMACSVQEALDLIEMRNSTGGFLTAFQNRRYDNDFLTLKKIISEKLTPIRLESRFERFRQVPKPGGWRETTSAKAGGGVLFDLGSHLLDQVHVLFGKPEKIYAEVKTRRQNVLADDDSFVALQYKTLDVHVHVSMMAAAPAPRFKLQGMEGGYEKWGLDPQEDALRSGQTPDSPGFGIEAQEASGTLHLDGKHKIISERGNYPAYYEAVAKAILSGGAPPVTAEEALLTLQIIEAARTSSKEGRVIDWRELASPHL